MNSVAGSLTTTANAARENSIKGPGKGGGERNIVSLLIAYFNRANVTTLFPFARISRLHRSTSSPRAFLFPILQFNPRVRPTRTESPAHRSPLDRSVISRQIPYIQGYFFHRLFSFQSFRIPNIFYLRPNSFV